MILNNFKLLDDTCINKIYSNCIWTFDIITNIDVSEQLFISEYQPLNSLLPIGGRKNYIKKSSDILDTFINTLNDLVFLKTQELVFSEKMKGTFQSRWPIEEEQFNHNMFAMTHIFKDPPNFSMGKHLDNQRVVGNAIVNLIDNSSTTEFFDYRDPDKVIFSTIGARNTGVLFLNTPAALHHIKNKNADRYIANSSIMIKKW
jgi:hypothetical protein